MNFDNRFFTEFKFSKEQIEKNFNNASRDLNIAKKDEILDVKFNYTYSAFIKAGLSLLSFHHLKVKSQPGHHVKIIEKISEILKDDSIMTTGNIMRSKRNLDFYAGGIEITEKECREFLEFTENILSKIKALIFS